MSREIGIATYSGYDQDGFPVIQYDSHGEPGKSGSVAPFAHHHTFGFMSRPRDPDVDEGEAIPDRGCELFVENEGDDTHGMLGHDPRYIPNLPSIDGGGSTQYGGDPERPTFATIDGEDGTLTIYVPVPATTKAHAITVGVDGNALPYLGLVHCDGMAITMLDGKIVIKNANGSSYIELGPSGIVLSGNVNTVGGFSAGNAALPLVTLAGLTTVIQELQAKIVAAIGSAPGSAGPTAALPVAALATAGTLLTKGT